MSVSASAAPESALSFWDYRERFKALMRHSLSSGGPTTYGSAESEVQTPLNERLIQAIWSHQMLAVEGMKLADGRPLRALDPGRWNGAAGPDFRGAKLMIGSQVVTGDIEVHLYASEWRAHRHESDMDYNSVVLHLVYQIDDGAKHDDLHNGERIPRLEIEPYVFPDIETIRRSLSPDDLAYSRPEGVGRCHDLMVGSDAQMVAAFLDRAGDERLIAKIRRLDDQVASAGDLEQVFYQSLMMSLGSGVGKSLYYLLAKRTPVRELLDYARELDPAERRIGIEAILLGVAGLLPNEIEANEDENDSPCVEAQEYAEQLNEIWERFKPYWSDRVIAATRRWYRGIRPVNFPCRRLGAVAEMLSRSLEIGAMPLKGWVELVQKWERLLRESQPTKRPHPAIRDLVSRLEIESPDSFWSDHYSFTAKPSAKKMALLGESTARSLMFNAVIPALGLWAKKNGNDVLAETAHKLYAIFPPLPSNHITEFMAHRLFGISGRDGDLINTERRQQALFQLFYSCCQGEERHCEACYYLKG